MNELDVCLWLVWFKLIIIQLMQQARQENLKCAECSLFHFMPETVSSDSVFQNQKIQVQCLFYFFQEKISGIEVKEPVKHRVLLRIRGQWVVEVCPRSESTLSKFRCNRHINFEVMRRKDEVRCFVTKGESQDWLAFGLVFTFGLQESRKVVLTIEEFERDRLQQFARALQAKPITQGGFYQVFKPIRRLGKGLTSVVYSALNTVDRRTYAVKCYQKREYSIQRTEIKEVLFTDTKRSFQKQFEIWRSLDNKRIARLIGVFQTDNSLYMVTEQLYVTLHTFITRYGYIKIRHVRGLLRDILEGLIYLHERGVMHRDIKLENIMIKRQELKEGRLFPVIVDFGLAQYIGQRPYLFLKCGTPGYTAPEILASDGVYDQKCDVFSLGIVAYTLLLKKFPFNSQTVPQVMQNNLRCNLQFNKEMEEVLGPEGVNFLSRMLAKDPARRMSAVQAYNHPFLLQREGSEEKLGSTQILLPEK